MAAKKRLDGSQLDATTLRRYFFGADGRHKLTYAEFSAFVGDLQREALKAEFLEYSRGLQRISQSDFAAMMLRYTDLDEAEQRVYFERLEAKLSLDEDVAFEDVELFLRLLNNLDDFSYAFRLIEPPATRKDFARAAKVSLRGAELSPRVIDVVFAMFDAAGDDRISYDEFFVVVRNRLHRQVRRSLAKRSGLEAFKQCVRDDLKRKS